MKRQRQKNKIQSFRRTLNPRVLTTQIDTSMQKSRQRSQSKDIPSQLHTTGTGQRINRQVQEGKKEIWILQRLILERTGGDLLGVEKEAGCCLGDGDGDGELSVGLKTERERHTHTHTHTQRVSRTFFSSFFLLVGILLLLQFCVHTWPDTSYLCCPSKNPIYRPPVTRHFTLPHWPQNSCVPAWSNIYIHSTGFPTTIRPRFFLLLSGWPSPLWISSALTGLGVFKPIEP